MQLPYRIAAQRYCAELLHRLTVRGATSVGEGRIQRMVKTRADLRLLAFWSFQPAKSININSLLLSCERP